MTWICNSVLINPGCSALPPGALPPMQSIAPRAATPGLSPTDPGRSVGSSVPPQPRDQNRSSAPRAATPGPKPFFLTPIFSAGAPRSLDLDTQQRNWPVWTQGRRQMRPASSACLVRDQQRCLDARRRPDALFYRPGSTSPCTALTAAGRSVRWRVARGGCSRWRW